MSKYISYGNITINSNHVSFGNDSKSGDIDQLNTVDDLVNDLTANALSGEDGNYKTQNLGPGLYCLQTAPKCRKTTPDLKKADDIEKMSILLRLPFAKSQIILDMLGVLYSCESGLAEEDKQIKPPSSYDSWAQLITDIWDSKKPWLKEKAKGLKTTLKKDEVSWSDISPFSFMLPLFASTDLIKTLYQKNNISQHGKIRLRRDIESLESSLNDDKYKSAKDLIEGLKKLITGEFDPLSEDGVLDLPEGFIYVFYKDPEDSIIKLYDINEVSLEENGNLSHTRYKPISEDSLSKAFVDIPAAYKKTPDAKLEEVESYVYFTPVILGQARLKYFLDEAVGSANFIQANDKTRLLELFIFQRNQAKENFKQRYKRTKGTSTLSQEYKEAYVTQDFWVDDLVKGYFTPKHTYPILPIDTPLYNLMNMNACVMYSYNMLKNAINEVQASEEGKAALLLAQRIFMSEYNGERKIEEVPGNLSYGINTVKDFYNFLVNKKSKDLAYLDEYKEKRRADLFFGELRSAKLELDAHEDLRKVRAVTDISEIEHSLKLNSRKFLKGLTAKLQDLVVSLLDDNGKDHLDIVWQDIFSQDIPAKIGAEDMCCNMLMPLGLDIEALDKLCQIEGHDLVPSIKFDIEDIPAKHEPYEYKKKDGRTVTRQRLVEDSYILCKGYTKTDYNKVADGIWKKTVAEYDGATNLVKKDITYVNAKDSKLGTDYKAVLSKQPVPAGIEYLSEVLQGHKGFSKYIFEGAKGEKYQGYFDKKDQEAIYTIDTILTAPADPKKPEDLAVFGDKGVCKKAIEYLVGYFGIKENNPSDPDYKRLEDIISKVLHKFEVKKQVQEQVKELGDKVHKKVKALLRKDGIKVENVYQKRLERFKKKAERQLHNTLDSLIGAITPNQKMTLKLIESPHQKLMLDRYNCQYGISTIEYSASGSKYSESVLSTQLDVAHANKYKEVIISQNIGGKDIPLTTPVEVKISRVDAAMLEIESSHFSSDKPYVEYTRTLEEVRQEQRLLNDKYYERTQYLFEGEQGILRDSNLSSNKLKIKGKKKDFLKEIGVLEIDPDTEVEIKSTTKTLATYRTKRFGQQLFGMGNIGFSVYSIYEILDSEKDLSAQDIVSLTKSMGDIIELGLEQRQMAIQIARSRAIDEAKAIRAFEKCLLRDMNKISKEALQEGFNYVDAQAARISDITKSYYAEKKRATNMLKNFKAFNSAVGGASALLNLADNALNYMKSLKTNDPNLQASCAYGIASAMAGLTTMAYEAALGMNGGKKAVQNKVSALVLEKLVTKKIEESIVDVGGKQLVRTEIKDIVVKKIVIRGAAHLAGYAVPIAGWALFIADIGFAVLSYVKGTERDTKFQSYIKASQFYKASDVDRANRKALFKDSVEQYSALLSLFERVSVSVLQNDDDLHLKVNLPSNMDKMNDDVKAYICARNYHAHSFSANTDEYLLLYIRDKDIFKKEYFLERPDKLNTIYSIQASKYDIYKLMVEMLAKSVSTGVYSVDEVKEKTDEFAQNLNNGLSHDNSEGGKYDTPYHIMILSKLVDKENKEVIITNDYMRKTAHYDEDQLRADDKYMNLIDKDYHYYGEIHDIKAFNSDLKYEKNMFEAISNPYSEVNESLSKGATLAIKERSNSDMKNLLHIFKHNGGLEKSISAVIIEKKQE